METSGTAMLRKAAPDWNLAGDKHLLGILENMHQNIMSKCQEVNARLDEMVTTLDSANIDLQNVNNKFMALSNTQFVESRVYDDDVDILEETSNKNEQPKLVEPESELMMLKRSLQILEDYHETVRILDSDSSDEEDDGRLVLKPKELYSHRPLPYIIGSYDWRNKWHVGLVLEDSDSDSASKPDAPSEEYSDSEPEAPRTLRDDLVEQRTVSSGSDIFSEPSPQVSRPADVAAEIAKRLGAAGVQIADPEPNVPEPTQRKLYKVEQPVISTIFSDEPPPLDQSEKDEYSDEDDIFAELHKNPYPYSNKEQNRMSFGNINNIVEDLFGDFENDFNVHSNKGAYENKQDNENEKASSSGKEKSTLFEDELEPHSFAQKENPAQKKSEGEVSTKKPIGGISLFGSNKGTESIGAAILRRNQRKSSSDEENDEVAEPKANTVTKITKEIDSKDVIKDLFVKPKANKKGTSDAINTAVKDKNVTKVEAGKPETKIDLFSDNIFDDVDDIFTTDIVTKSKEARKEKSLFDDDDDDLFSDVTVTTQAKEKKPVQSIFDSDDDLFRENTPKNDRFKETIKNTSPDNIKVTKTPKSMFSDESDDDLFTKRKLGETSATLPELNVSKTAKLKENTPQTEISSKKSLIDVKLNVNTEANSLFKDDSDSEIFAKVKVNTKNSVIQETTASKTNNTNKGIFVDEAQDVTVKNKNNNEITDSKDRSNIHIFDTESPSNKTQVSNVRNDLSPKENKEVDIKTNDILNDDWEDNLFLGVKNSDKVSQSTVSSAINKKVVLVDDEFFEVASKGNVKVSEETSSTKEKTIGQSITPVISNININKPDPVFESPSLFDVDDIDMHNDGENNNNDTNSINRGNSEQLPSAMGTSTKEITHDSVKSSFSPKKAIIRDTENIQKPQTPDQMRKTEIGIETDDFTSNISSKESGYDELFNSLPPEFEKPVEAKKSKNINALFDDDSDDEASFFKKNDVISDEKPELAYGDERFTIFHDEPPDIDIDFSQKPRQTRLGEQEYSDDDIFVIKQKTHEETTKKYEQNINTRSTSTQDCAQIDVVKPTDNQEVKSKSVDISQLLWNGNLLPETHDNNIKDTSDNNLSTQYIEKNIEIASNNENIDVDFDSDIIDTPEADKRKIGKLKPTNLNINVNTLLPGAVVTAKIKEEIDGQTFSTKSNEELNRHTPVESKSKIVKSVSFDDKADAGVLDNKLSKERARIKVKRRPSSRRARLEAVRKSGIDFGEDSTDNSSSFDEPPKVIDADKVSILDRIENLLPSKSQLDRESMQEITKNNLPSNNERVDYNLEETKNILPVSTSPNTKTMIKTTATVLPSSDAYINKKTEVENAINVVPSSTTHFNEESLLESTINEPFNVKANSNEDQTPERTEKIQSSSKFQSDGDMTLKNNKSTEFISEPSKIDRDNSKSENNDKIKSDNSKIKTDNVKGTDENFTDYTSDIKNTKKDVKSKVVYILNDEDIFTNTNTVDIKKTNLGNKRELTVIDDTDDELFKSAPKTSLGHGLAHPKENVDKDKKLDSVQKAKKSIFDDLSDDDDLFTNKVKSDVKSDSKSELFSERDSKSVIKQNTATKNMKSLFGDESDEELFTVKPTTSLDVRKVNKPKDVTSLASEAVNDDPLSMFNDSDS